MYLILSFILYKYINKIDLIQKRPAKQCAAGLFIYKKVQCCRYVVVQ
jgi:hypothetical protein